MGSVAGAVRGGLLRSVPRSRKTSSRILCALPLSSFVAAQVAGVARKNRNEFVSTQTRRPRRHVVPQSDPHSSGSISSGVSATLIRFCGKTTTSGRPMFAIVQNIRIRLSEQSALIFA